MGANDGISFDRNAGTVPPAAEVPPRTPQVGDYVEAVTGTTFLGEGDRDSVYGYGYVRDECTLGRRFELFGYTLDFTSPGIWVDFQFKRNGTDGSLNPLPEPRGECVSSKGIRVIGTIVVD